MKKIKRNPLSWRRIPSLVEEELEVDFSFGFETRQMASIILICEMMLCFKAFVICGKRESREWNYIDIHKSTICTSSFEQNVGFNFI